MLKGAPKHFIDMKVPDMQGQKYAFNIIGLEKHSPQIIRIYRALTDFVGKQKDPKKIQKEVLEFQYKCTEKMKVMFKLEDCLKNFKENFIEVLKSFDLSQPDKIIIRYNKISRPDLKWDEIKTEVEQELPTSL